MLRSNIGHMGGKIWKALGAVAFLGALSGVADAAPLPAPPPGSFLKGGNNGSISCANFCAGAQWGTPPNNKSGSCVAAYTGTTASANRVDCNAPASHCFCNSMPPPLPPGAPAAPSGATIKDGNNGEMSCDAYCKSGQFGTSYNYCVHGWAGGSGQVACSQGVRPRTVCYCTNTRAAPVPPPPPPGAWVKDGNNGTVTCDQFCGNTLANWGKLGTCVGGWGATSGNALSCSQQESPHTVCFCKDHVAPVQPAPPAGAWVKDGNNGTVTCDAFCSNNHNDGGHNWGKLGECVSGWGANTGKTIACDASAEVPHTVCFCKDGAGGPAAPALASFEKTHAMHASRSADNRAKLAAITNVPPQHQKAHAALTGVWGKVDARLEYCKTVADPKERNACYTEVGMVIKNMETLQAQHLINVNAGKAK